MHTLSLVRPNFEMKSRGFVKEFIIIAAASLFVALCSQIALPLFFTPLPFSMQTLGVLAVGATLGKWRGSLAIALYLLEGAMGMPVFALGGGSLASLIGPTGGYLFGFIPAAYIAGYSFERTGNIVTLGLSFLLGNAAIYACGLPWLSLWIGPAMVLQLGLYPFIIGDLLKVALLICYFRFKR